MTRCETTTPRALLAVVLASALASCTLHAPSETARFEGEAMGTTWVVLVAEPVSPSDRIILERAIVDELTRVDEHMSHYRPDSELSRFNELAADTPFPVSTATFEVFAEAMRVSELTRGAFDVTVAPLVERWGFGPGAAAGEKPPTEAELSALRARVGYEKIELDDDAQTIRKTVPGVVCDLSGIAKGYAVDRVAAALDEHGIANYMVEVGGEVRTLGKNASDEAWRIALERPQAQVRAIQRVISLSGLSVASSGDYRNFYEVNGKMYSHLIDPRTSKPVEHALAAVSVVDHTCMRADALASGLLVLGPEEGYRVAVEEDLAVLFQIRSGADEIEERATPAFEQLFY